MSSTYSLLIQSADGVSWKPGPFHRKVPNLYVVIYQDGVKMHRTKAMRGLAPKWEHLAQIPSDSESSTISLRLFHDSSLLGGDKYLGVVDTNIAALLRLCVSDADPKFASISVTGVDGKLNGKPAGTLSVRLMRDVEAAETALEHAQRDVGKLGFGATASGIITVAGVATQSVSAADNLVSALDSLTSKLEIIVLIGDKIATIHPYANIAWKVLTSVYKAVKKQQETDDNLCRLVDTMTDAYSFVEDIEFLAERMKSLEDKVLAIVKQTVESALFIQEYTVNGFCSRAVRNAWSDADKQIDELSAIFMKLKASFHTSLTVQSLFLSTKMLQQLEGLVQSDTLKRLNPVDMNATSRTPCLSGTRIKILDEITEWLMVPSDSGSIFWLSGVAGSGKSTIATTVSESFRGVDRLGAFLFFDRNDRARSHPDAVIRTLAYALALSNANIGAAISGAIQRDPALVTAPIRTQFQTLLLEPLRSVEPSIQGPILIILDALDECGDLNSRAALLSIISTEFPKLPHLFRFLITGRREQDLTDYFASCFTEKDLDTTASTEDVGLFIQHEMDRVRQQRKLGPTWPGEQRTQTLINVAGGLFIWASTAVRFIDGYRPNTRLETVINQNFTHGLDILYSIALRNSGPWDSDETFAEDSRAVLACLVLGRVPMTDGTMDMLLGSGNQTSAVLKHLGCVVQWSPGTHARTLHASFADYLTDPNRSGGKPWAIDTRVGHRALSLGCLRILNSELRFNICGLEDSHLLNADVLDLSNRVATTISPQLSYSSCFWFNHIQETTFDEHILRAIDNLFHRKVLYWLEVLSLLGQITIASTAIGAAAKYSKDYDDDLTDFLTDTRKFVSAFVPAIAQSAPHIYLSAVPFAPHQSKLAQNFIGCFPQTLGHQGALGTHWPSIQKALHGHTRWVTSVRFSPDGAQLASGDGRTIRVWDAQTGALVSVADALTAGIGSIHFSPDGTQIASGFYGYFGGPQIASGYYYIVCVWDAQTGALIAGPFKWHTGTNTCIHFSPDGARIASGSEDKTVCVWDARTGELVAGPLTGHTDQVCSVNFSPDGMRIASGSDDNTVRVWNYETGAVVAAPFDGHTDRVTSVYFSPDGKRIASGSDDKTVRVWDAQTGILIAGPFDGHTAGITSVHFSPHGTRIASGSNDGTVRVWDAQSGALICGPFKGGTKRVTSVHFSPDGTKIASGCYDGIVRIWDAQSEALVLEPFEGHTDYIRSVHFSSDGTRITSGSDDNTVRVWNSETGAVIAAPFEGHTDGVASVHFSPDGTQIASGSRDRTVRVWDAKTGALVVGPLEGHTDSACSVTFSPDGSRIASGSYDLTVRVWDAETGALVAGPFEGHTEGVSSVHFSPDGMRIASGSDDGTVHVWDARSGALVAGPFEGHTEYVTSVHFSPDGMRIASGSDDKTVRVWDVQTGALVTGPFEGHTGSVSSVNFSPDGTRIASGSWDNTLRIWNTQTGELVAGPFEGHTHFLTSVHFSPDGARITSGSYDHTVRISEINPPLKTPLGDFPIFNSDSGWISNTAGELMLWVPPWLREGLYLPHNTLVICAKGTTKLDLSRFVHGTEWQKCIDPIFRDTK